ncbi:hypothetical protein Slin15195_G107620 [Septoria linicola]|uniref:Uncharacterized protein n=1 Tax=Septoria linicola TaxID=215465 RepID=A0A9Q9B1Z7_9PEZI|nr:hypothetical protein Slin15195_G107620 [Septoria linicola]
MSALWNKDRPTEAAASAAQQAATLDRMRKGLVPGTWLQLSPNTAPVQQVQEKWLSLSPKANALPSPAMAAEKIDVVADELVLDGDRFLSNNASASRSSSISSTASNSIKVSSFKPVSSVCEREVIGLARFRAE